MTMALIAGLSFGLVGLPLSWGWLGLLWPWFFLSAFRTSVGSKKVLFFCLGVGQTQMGWLFPVFQQVEDRPLWLAALLFEANLLITYLPLALLLSLVSVLGSRQKRWAPSDFFWVCFPPAYLTFLWLSDFSPMASLPLPSIATRALVMDLLGGSYRLMGTKGVELVLLFVALAFAWMTSKPQARAIKGGVFIGLLLAGLVAMGQFNHQLAEGPVLRAAYLPWSGSLGDAPTRRKAVRDMIGRTASAAQLDVDLVIWPEQALPGEAESGPDLENLAKALKPHQALLLGGNHQEPAGDRSHTYNWAYLVKGSEFQFEVYRQQTLSPWIETTPFWAAGLPLGINPRPAYQPGELALFQVGQFTLAPGLGFEPCLDRWYAEREADVMGYVFLSSEFVFPLVAKQVLESLGRAKALQTDKPVLKVANGALSGLVSKPSARQTTGAWHPKIKGGEIALIGQLPPSPFYQFGRWLLLPLSWLTALGALLGLGQRQKKPEQPLG